MKRRVLQTKKFAATIDSLIAKKKLLVSDFEQLKKLLVENPEEGDLIRGTGGIRKVRLKSASKGKSGGFRVCYFDHPEAEELFLLLIYPKNEQEDLTPADRKILKELIDTIKRR